MEVLNINSYYFSSSLHKFMEENLMNAGFNLSTYVPLMHNYKLRDEVTSEPPEHVDAYECFRRYDRYLFHYKHFKIKKDFFRRYNLKNYDVLHAHSLFSNGYIAYKAKVMYQIPYIVAVRDTDINVFFKKMPHLRNLGLNILINADKVIFLSNSYKRQCIDNYVSKKYKSLIQTKAVVIPNGIDEYWFKNKRNTSEINPDEVIKIIFVGNDSKRKNLNTLIKSCNLLIQQRYNVELTVVGKISDERNKEKLEKHEFVKVKGPVQKEELLRLYRQNDIFVMPSITETFGLVYAEAMSQGLPVIYTKDQGFDGQFEEGVVGYSVDPLNDNEIVEKILKVISRYNSLSERCVTLVNKFNWKNVIKNYEKVYCELKN